MQALSFDQHLEFRTDVPRPVAPEGESLVRVLLAGICNTDLEITRGYQGFRGILGHEFVGIAETGPLAGRRVVGEINASCGSCVMCATDNRTHCLHRTVLGIHNRDGAMAEFLMLPDENLHPVPDSVDDEQAVFVEPLAAALEILDQAHIRPSERAVVIGDGKLGQLVTQVLALTGCDLTLVGRHAGKLARAATRSIPTSLEGDALRLNGADIVVDCTGTEGGLALAAQLVRARGRIHHFERQIARDGRGRWPLRSWIWIPWPVRRELELLVPVARDDSREIRAESAPLGVCPGVEMKPVAAVVNDAVGIAIKLPSVCVDVSESKSMPLTV